ncbi:hypothetical protein BV22DRAFT_74185 [Leucogyrophana mollusca]|uniref:Uncharacterized protein n=1 Tax=Leucogyrophana mollusca TaxID=85980 RepID=A0ACB8BYJ3_9AGAM|nr:hypothetical protein BV22DRAFT_74185 [Leucogyrophana mollusca]
MAPSNNTEAASQVTVPSSSLHARTLPIASIVVLTLCILLMNYLTGYVLFRQLYDRRKSKSAPRARPTSEKGSTSGSRWRVRPLFPKLRPVKKPNRSASAVGALHATCTLVAAAPPKLFCPPVVMQIQLPNKAKTILLYGTGLPGWNTDDKSPQVPCVSALPGRDRSQPPISRPPKGEPIRSEQDTGIITPVKGLLSPRTPLRHVSYPRPVHLPCRPSPAARLSIQEPRASKNRPPGRIDLSDWARAVHGQPPLSPKEIIEDMMTNPKLSPVLGPVEFLEVHERAGSSPSAQRPLKPKVRTKETLSPPNRALLADGLRVSVQPRSTL